MIQTILFDFDGTLFDTGEGILRSVQYALEGFGIHETDTARLRKFVGPPLLDSFSELYAMTSEQAQAAVARYRERYLPVGIYECTLYLGIPELLERLRAHGFRIAVATGKPTPMARSILQRFDLERLFDCVIGCEYDGTRSTKAEVVAAALAETQTAPEAALMVGGRKYGVTGAAACGVPCLGVYYGYAEPGELEAAGAAGAALAATVSAAGAALAAGGAAAATPPSSMIASNCWLVTVAPSANLISLSTPSTGDGTSNTTLSVSRSSRFSSRLSASPAFLCQVAMVARDTDSGRTGTLTSVAMRASCR